jgi:hypothetical protein
VEKLRADGYTVVVSVSGYEEFAYVHIHKSVPYKGDTSLMVVDKASAEMEHAATAPEAICLAALKALTPTDSEGAT